MAKQLLSKPIKSKCDYCGKENTIIKYAVYSQYKIKYYLCDDCKKNINDKYVYQKLRY